jgi:hypothetical protein
MASYIMEPKKYFFETKEVYLKKNKEVRIGFLMDGKGLFH